MRLTWAVLAGVTAVVLAAFSLIVLLTANEPAATPYKAPRTADGKPNLNGIWQAINTAHWDIQDHMVQPSPVLTLGALGGVPAGEGVVEGNEIPYQPWALKKKQENHEKRLLGDRVDRFSTEPIGTGDPRGR